MKYWLRLGLVGLLVLVPLGASAQMSKTDGTLATSNTDYERGRGGTPGVSACGTTPSVTGKDGAGLITVGTGGVAASCTLTFSATYTPAPFCVTVPGGVSAINLNSSTTTTTLITTTPGAFPASAPIYYLCALP